MAAEASTHDGVAPAGECPYRVRHPLMDQDWLSLSFLHWRYDPELVQRLLPGDVRVETFDGAAWIGLIPFVLRVRIPRGPALPWIGVFPEINVRTYVRGPDGESGIWFLSLDAPRRLAIWAARTTYRLPYRVAAMRFEDDGVVRRCVSWRDEGAQRGATCRAGVVAGMRIAPHDVTPLEHFLTARWRLYAPLRRGIGTAKVEHPPWGLHRAVAEDVDAHLLAAAGLPLPREEPLVHAADDVHASLTPLRRCTPWQGAASRS